MAFSPDGRTLATGGGGGTISVWDIPTRVRVAGLHGHTNWIWSLAFSSDGKSLASGARDGTVRIWDFERACGPELIPAKGNKWSAIRPGGSWRTPLAFSSLGSTGVLATAAPENALRLLDPKRRQEIRALPGHRSGVNALSFSPDGKWLAAGSGGPAQPGEIVLWELPEGRAGPPLEQRGGVFSCVAFSFDGKTLAGGTGKAVKLWDVATGKLRGTLAGHTGDVASVAFSPDGAMLAAATLDFREYPGGVERHPPGQVRLWELATSQVRRTIQWSLRHGSVAFSPDGEFLAAGSGDEIQLWHAPKDSELGRSPQDFQDEDIEALSKLVRESADDWSAWNRRGVAHRKLRRWDDALADFSKAIELKKDEAAPWSNRASCHVECGRWTEAAADLTQAIALGESCYWAWSQLAQCHLALGNTQDYEKACRSMIEQFPAPDQRSDRDWGHIGQALYRVGRYEEARAALEKVIELRGDDGPTLLLGPRWWYYTLTLCRLGESERARSYFDQLADLMKNDLRSDENLHAFDHLRAEAAELLKIAPDKERTRPAR